MNTKNVLVVDDFPIIAEQIEEILSGLRVQVFGATDADQALEMFKKHKPICVFMDGHLVQGENADRSIALVKEMRKFDSKVRIIAHSSSSDVNQQLMDVGCDENVLKNTPGYHNHITQEVRHVLDQKHEHVGPTRAHIRAKAKIYA